MKTSAAVLASLSLLATTLTAADKPAAPAEHKPHPVTLTFYVTGVECGGCIDSITREVNEVPSVTNIEVSIIGGYANISFDTHVSSAHQIAQAIAEALPLHVKPYAASLKIRIPDYAKDGNAAKVDAVFAKRANWVTVEPVDKAKGEFVIHFLPLQRDPAQKGPQGWNPGHFGHAIHDPAPKGLGLAFSMAKED